MLHRTSCSGVAGALLCLGVTAVGRMALASRLDQPELDARTAARADDLCMTPLVVHGDTVVAACRVDPMGPVDRVSPVRFDLAAGRAERLAPTVAYRRLEHLVVRPDGVPAQLVTSDMPRDVQVIGFDGRIDTWRLDGRFASAAPVAAAWRRGDPLELVYPGDGGAVIVVPSGANRIAPAPEPRLRLSHGTRGDDGWRLVWSRLDGGAVRVVVSDERGAIRDGALVPVPAEVAALGAPADGDWVDPTPGGRLTRFASPRVAQSGGTWGFPPLDPRGRRDRFEDAAYVVDEAGVRQLRLVDGWTGPPWIGARRDGDPAAPRWRLVTATARGPEILDPEEPLVRPLILPARDGQRWVFDDGTLGYFRVDARTLARSDSRSDRVRLIDFYQHTVPAQPLVLQLAVGLLLVGYPVACLFGAIFLARRHRDDTVLLARAEAPWPRAAFEWLAVAAVHRRIVIPYLVMTLLLSPAAVRVLDLL